MANYGISVSRAAKLPWIHFRRTDVQKLTFRPLMSEIGISLTPTPEPRRILCRGWVSQTSCSTKRNMEPPWIYCRAWPPTTLTFRCQPSRNHQGSIVGLGYRKPAVRSIVGLGLHHSDISLTLMPEPPRIHCRVGHFADTHARTAKDPLPGLGFTNQLFDETQHGTAVDLLSGLASHHSDISLSAIAEPPRIHCRAWVSQTSGSTYRTAVVLLSGLASTTLTFRCQPSRNHQGSTFR